MIFSQCDWLKNHTWPQMSFQGCDGAELLDWLFDQNDTVEKLEWLFDPNDGSLRHEGAGNHGNHHNWPVSEENVRDYVFVSTDPWQTMQVFGLDHSTGQQKLSPVFPPDRCSRRPTRRTVTSSTLSWVLLYQTHLRGPRTPVTVGSVRIPRQTRSTALSVPRAPREMLHILLQGQREALTATSPQTAVSRRLRSIRITPSTGLYLKI